MKVTPRKAEVAAVVELLESDGYDSADALAKDIIKRVAELFAERDWYAFVHRFSEDSSVYAWGPLSSDTEVTRLAKKAGLGGEARSLKLNSTAALLAWCDEEAPSQFCSGCDHPHGAHDHPRMGGRCAVRGCTCVSDKK